MLHGSETWPVKIENKMALQWTEMTMIRWMCSVKGDVQRFFTKLTKKVVLSCLLQYKPVCVINFDKLIRKMLKRRSLVQL